MTGPPVNPKIGQVWESEQGILRWDGEGWQPYRDKLAAEDRSGPDAITVEDVEVALSATADGRVVLSLRTEDGKYLDIKLDRAVFTAALEALT